MKDVYLHTFPLLSLLGARISGAGMGGRDNASLIPLLMGGLWPLSLGGLVHCDVACPFDLAGVPRDCDPEITVAVRTAPCLVHLHDHAICWVGEVLCSCTLFLVMLNDSTTVRRWWEEMKKAMALINQPRKSTGPFWIFILTWVLIHQRDKSTWLNNTGSCR